MRKKKHKKMNGKVHSKTNGKAAHSTELSKREAIAEARARVLRVAQRRGFITNTQARVVGHWNQAWYHLNAMRKAKLLVYEGFNIWKPRPPKKDKRRARARA